MAIATATTPEEKAFTASIEKLSFLIADPTSSRKSIRNLISQFGAKAQLVFMAETVSDSKKLLEEKQPNVLFIDSALIEGSKVDFLDLHRKSIKPPAQYFSIVLTNKGSKLAATQYTEDTVDAVLYKPFNFDDLKAKTIEALNRKLKPTPFQKVVDSCKKLLDDGQNELALELLEKAKALDPKSSLPYALQGSAYLHLNNKEEAKKAFEQGIAINPNTYKCLIQLLDLYFQDGDQTKAYEIGKKLAEIHTLPITRIPDMVKLSLMNKNFDDIMQFYTLVESLSDTDPNISLALGAGLVTCGLHYLNEKVYHKVSDFFKKAEMITKGNAKIQKRILTALIGAGFEDDIKWMSSRVSDEVQNSTEVEVAWVDYYILKKDFETAHKVCNKLLSQKKIKDAKLYKLTITVSKELKRRHSILDDIVSDACRDFPNQAAEFQKMIADYKVD